ncbi:hypothetical protein GCM10009760_55670 [Kitasatospora kazusensis]|uniref:PLL-like beta propeller domain-containing protein n=1 Tax=Kitasatospora kazusensis TaxID=407974 RepID=A0ABP5LWX2_9ACTN
MVAAAVLVGVGIGIAPAQATTLAPHTVGSCTSPQFGGGFYCGDAYGSGQNFYTFEDGTTQIFVIGMDHAVWSRWTYLDGGMSSWMSLGGYLTSKVSISNADGGSFTIGAIGGDGHTMWYRDRDGGGNWTAWHE